MRAGGRASSGGRCCRRSKRSKRTGTDAIGEEGDVEDACIQHNIIVTVDQAAVAVAVGDVPVETAMAGLAGTPFGQALLGFSVGILAEPTGWDKAVIIGRFVMYLAQVRSPKELVGTINARYRKSGGGKISPLFWEPIRNEYQKVLDALPTGSLSRGLLSNARVGIFQHYAECFITAHEAYFRCYGRFGSDEQLQDVLESCYMKVTYIWKHFATIENGTNDREVIVDDGFMGKEHGMVRRSQVCGESEMKDDNTIIEVRSCPVLVPCLW